MICQKKCSGVHMYTVPYSPRAFNAYLISYPSCPCQAGSYSDGANNTNCLGRTGRQCDFSRDGYRTCQPYASEGFAYNIYQGGGWRWPKSSRKCRRFLEINILLARPALFSVQWWVQEYTHTVPIIENCCTKKSQINKFFKHCNCGLLSKAGFC